jgi:hypothetical protein
MAKLQQKVQTARSLGPPQNAPIARSTFQTELERLSDNIQSGHKETTELEQLIDALIGAPMEDGTGSACTPTPQSVFGKLSFEAENAGSLGYRLERLVRRLRESV